MSFSPIGVTDFSGRRRIEPDLFSQTDLQKQTAVRLGALNDIIVFGNFPSGDIDVIQTFDNAADFEATHDPDKNDDVSVQLVKRMKAPFLDSLIAGAGVIRSSQVGNHTKATRTWLATATPKIVLTTAINGLPANKCQSKFETGTAADTAKVSVQKRNDPATLIERDNLGLGFDILRAAGPTIATITITVASDVATTLILIEDAVTVASLDISGADKQFDTLGKVVGYINDLSGYTCSLATGADPTLPATQLDAAAAVNTLVSYAANALLGAIVHYINKNVAAYFTAVRSTGETIFGDFDTDFVFATGGTNPVVTITEWQDALAILDDEDLGGGFVFPITTDQAIQSAFRDFIITQFASRSKTWRMPIATAPGATLDAAKTLAFNMNHTRVMVCFQRIQDSDPNNPDSLADFDPIHLAAIMTGGSASTPLTHPLTNKRLNIKGLKDKFGKTEREDGLSNGVMVARTIKGFGHIPSMAVSTSLDNKRMPRVWADSMAADFLHNNINIPLRAFVGQWADDQLRDGAEMLIGRVLELAEISGVISKGQDDAGAVLEAFLPPTVTIAQGLLKADWKAFIGGEIDFIGVRGDVEYQSFGVAVPI